jgi:hypothetical protein
MKKHMGPIKKLMKLATRDPNAEVVRKDDQEKTADLLKRTITKILIVEQVKIDDLEKTGENKLDLSTGWILLHAFPFSIDLCRVGR